MSDFRIHIETTDATQLIEDLQLIAQQAERAHKVIQAMPAPKLSTFRKLLRFIRRQVIHV